MNKCLKNSGSSMQLQPSSKLLQPIDSLNGGKLNVFNPFIIVSPVRMIGDSLLRRDKGEEAVVELGVDSLICFFFSLIISQGGFLFHSHGVVMVINMSFVFTVSLDISHTVSLYLLNSLFCLHPRASTDNMCSTRPLFRLPLSSFGSSPPLLPGGRDRDYRKILRGPQYSTSVHTYISTFYSTEEGRPVDRSNYQSYPHTLNPHILTSSLIHSLIHTHSAWKT